MYIVNINEINNWINVFYGEVLIHGNKEEKEKANIIIDYINFLEKKSNIMKCEICGRRFVQKNKKTTCCSEDCKKEKRKQNSKKFYENNKQEINKKYKEYRKEYFKNHQEEKMHT